MAKVKTKLDELKAQLKDTRLLLIVMQNYPDPDAIASAAALRILAHHIGDISVTITSSGVVGRAENQALMKYMHLPFRRLYEIEPAQFDQIAMVDTQPQTGNNGLPDDYPVHVVFDHHPIRKATRSVPFHDVRSHYGSCATILHEYLIAAGAPVDCRLATALIYGIRSDTQDLGRESHRKDLDCFIDLYPKANHRMLHQIEYSRTPRSYYRMLETALRNGRVYEERLILSCMGDIDIPDIVGEMADLFLRDEDSRWTLCYGYFHEHLLLSLRTADEKADAGDVMRQLVRGLGAGGGHKAMAGGQIPLPSPGSPARKEVVEKMQKRLFRVLKIKDTEGFPLTASPGDNSSHE